jgi:inosine/guanosine/xanthosine phosphorylase family protein
VTEIARSVAAIRRAHPGAFPRAALILGSGLGRFGTEMEVDATIPYEEIDGFPRSTVQGHAGRLLIGRIGSAPLICMQGRMHLYEGHPPQALAIPIRVLRELGVETLVLTNAAGGINPALGPGAVMLIEDHINLSGLNPLAGPNDGHYGPRFFDMSNAYDPGLREALRRAAAATGLALQAGVYAQLLGPNFETPAEIRMLAQLGADAVGMSTVPECLVARHCGMRVAGLSIITNAAAGIGAATLSHEETLAEAEKASAKVCTVLRHFFEARPS